MSYDRDLDRLKALALTVNALRTEYESAQEPVTKEIVEQALVKARWQLCRAVAVMPEQ